MAGGGDIGLRMGVLSLDELRCYMGYLAFKKCLNGGGIACKAFTYDVDVADRI